MKKYLLSLALFVVATPALANTTGYAWSESLGWFDFSNAVVSDTNVTGYAYNDNTGWLVLDGITNTNGTLSGYAWSESVGYFDFSDVSITNGTLDGYAYNDNTGWLSFSDGTTVTTTWTPAIPPTTPPTTTTRSSGSSGSKKVITPPTTTPNTNTSSTPTPETLDSCLTPIYLTKAVKFGTNNNPEDVKLLERFLNTYEGYSIPVDGIYSASDMQAIIKWQEKYTDDILKPWGIDEGTGYVYLTSLKKIKEIHEAYCKTPTKPQTTTPITPQPIMIPITPNTSGFARGLTLDMTGDDVKQLQQLLISKGYTIPAGATGYFGTQTLQALIKFQQANKITPSMGYFGPVTRTFIRTLKN